MHRCDAGLEHLDCAQQGLRIGHARTDLALAARRHLEQHEELQRHIGECAAHHVAGRMKMAVDEARHRQFAVRLDHTIDCLGGEVRPERGDAPCLDQDVGGGIFAAVVIQGQHARLADQGACHDRLRQSRAKSAASSGDTPAMVARGPGGRARGW